MIHDTAYDNFKYQKILLQVLFNSERSPNCSMFFWDKNEGVICTEGVYPGQHVYDLEEMNYPLKPKGTFSKRNNDNKLDKGGYKYVQYSNQIL